MARPSYATPANYVDSDYYDQDEGLPEDERRIVKLLARASRHIESLTITAVYETDEDGAPVDLDISEAFRDAVCAQVAYWEETGDASGVGAIGSTSIGSLSLGSAPSAGQTHADRQGVRYAPEAVEILSAAGLLSSAVRR